MSGGTIRNRRGCNNTTMIEGNLTEGRRIRASRQQPPVSCHFCRVRKLRCNRAQPCSNCVSRGIPCQPSQAQSSPTEPAPTGAVPITPASQGPPTIPDTDVLQRVERLEKLLAIQSERWSQLMTGHPELFRSNPTSAEDDHLSLPTNTHSTPSSSSTLVQKANPLNEFSHDVVRLEQISVGSSFPESTFPFRFCFEISPLRQAINSPLYTQHTTFIPNQSKSRSFISIRLPYYPEAEILLEKFIKDVCCFHHVVHIPTLRDTLESLYIHLNEEGQVQPGHIILLLSIIASATYFWTDHDCDGGILATTKEADHQATLWTKATQDLVDACHRSTCLSLEAVQGIVIILFVIGNAEGCSYRYRFLVNLALMMCRELDLHRIDHPSTVGKFNIIQAEVGRRIWWYLVATDWLLAARYTGLTEGIYQTDPRRMMVNKPRNVNDEDLSAHTDIVGKSLEEATSLSYLLQRIRIAEVSRQLIDRSSLFATTAGGLNYNAVLEADNELESFFNEIPRFFHLSDRNNNVPHDSPAASSVAIQRYFVNSLFHSQRCRLHLPYLARGSVDQMQVYSRKICLDSASKIIQAELNLERENRPFARTRLKLTGILYSVFVASIALVMDMNLNRRDPNPQPETRSGEVAEAIRILQSAERQSPSAASLLQSMMAILRKNSVPSYQAVQRGLGHSAIQGSAEAKAPLQTPSSQLLQTGNELPLQSMSLDAPEFEEGNQVMDPRMPDVAPIGMDLASYFDELTQSWDPRMSMDDTAWNNMFSELDASFL